MKETILLTGATSDIGCEIYKNLIDTYDIVLMARDPKKVTNIYSNVPYQNVVYANLEEPENTKQILYEHLNNNDIIINHFIHCAGLLQLEGIKSITYKNQIRIFNVNLFSAIQIIQVLLNKKNRPFFSTISFISSLWSIRGTKGNSIYASSKGSLNSLCINLAVELAPKIRVNSILPGAIITNMSKESFVEKNIEEVNKDYLLGLGSTSDIAGIIKFIISKEARWITGQNIIVDGGKSCK
ncbi:MAG: SDR family oxidoreductase [Candidatus Cloacimonas sp.]|jgi:short-subunit dehydrogenase|nr:SDR family oxidoreductase [Candidatus Cloacimonas sp.]